MSNEPVLPGTTLPDDLHSAVSYYDC